MALITEEDLALSEEEIDKYMRAEGEAEKLQDTILCILNQIPNQSETLNQWIYESLLALLTGCQYKKLPRNLILTLKPCVPE